jgi:FkbM family methyltransferase
LNLLATLCGNRPVQSLLECNVKLSLYLMGIGSGAGVSLSGEKVLVQRLRRQYTATQRPLCVFDVGANTGQFLTFVLDGLQGLPLCVHAFEPSQYTYRILAENTTGRANVFLNNVGLGKQKGELDLFYNEAGSSLASLYQRKLDHAGLELNYSEQVTIEALDSYCESHGVQYIDLLKLDVEGHELDVLLGGQQMFQDGRIKMVSFEFGGTDIDSKSFFRDFWYFFRENGMARIYRITPSGYLVQIQRYQEFHEQFRTTNFLVLQD